MKHKQSMVGFISGILVSVLLAGAVLPAAAGQSIWVDSGVKVYVNDMPIDAGDTHGNPDAFIYNGTTYVAAAAVSKSLGENVKWEGSTKSVYIGKHEGSSSYLLNVCPPYQTSGYDAPATVTMSGKKYANCMRTYGYAIFNLDGKYDTLSFVVGHIDGRDMDKNQQYNIYLDGELAFSIDLDPEAMPKRYEIDLDGAIQMKIEGTTWGYSFALADMKVS